MNFNSDEELIAILSNKNKKYQFLKKFNSSENKFFDDKIPKKTRDKKYINMIIEGMFKKAFIEAGELTREDIIDLFKRWEFEKASSNEKKDLMKIYDELLTMDYSFATAVFIRMDIKDIDASILDDALQPKYFIPKSIKSTNEEIFRSNYFIFTIIKINIQTFAERTSSNKSLNTWQIVTTRNDNGSGISLDELEKDFIGGAEICHDIIELAIAGLDENFDYPELRELGIQTSYINFSFLMPENSGIISRAVKVGPNFRKKMQNVIKSLKSKEYYSYSEETAQTKINAGIYNGAGIDQLDTSIFEVVFFGFFMIQKVSANASDSITYYKHHTVIDNKSKKGTCFLKAMMRCGAKYNSAQKKYIKTNGGIKRDQLLEFCESNCINIIEDNYKFSPDFSKMYVKYIKKGKPSRQIVCVSNNHAFNLKTSATLVDFSGCAETEFHDDKLLDAVEVFDLKKARRTYIVYDIETVPDFATNTCVSRSCSYMRVDGEELFTLKPADYKSRIITSQTQDSKCIDKFLAYLLSLPASRKVILIGYNSSNFDDWKLMSAIVDYNNRRGPLQGPIEFTPTITKKRIKLKFRNIETFDLFRNIAPQTLEAACRAFNISKENRKITDGIPHDEVCRRFNSLAGAKEQRSGVATIDERLAALFTPEEQKAQIDYNTNDVAATLEIFVTVKKAFEELHRPDVSKELHSFGAKFIFEDSMTIGQSAMKIFRSLVKEKKIPIGLKYDNNTDYSFVRSAKIAGISSILERIEYYKRMGDFDKVSFYTEALLRFDAIYPRSDATLIKTGKNEFMPNFCGIYHITNVDQSNLRLKQKIINIIPRKTENGFDWYADHIDSIIVCSTDILQLEKEGCRFTIESGCYWDKSITGYEAFHDYFETYITEKCNQDELKKKKDKNYSSGKREFAKLMMNVITGKLMQIFLYDDKVVISNQEATIDKSLRELDEETVTKLDDNGKYIIRGKLKSEFYDITRSRKRDFQAYAIFMYAYARKSIRNEAIAHFEVALVETDGFVAPIEAIKEHLLGKWIRTYDNKAWMKLLNLGTEKKQIGQYTISYETDNLIVLEKKNYYMHLVNDGKKIGCRLPSEEQQIRFKGISFNSKVIDENLIPKDDAGYMKYCNEVLLSESADRVCTAETFRKLLHGEKLAGVFSYIGKTYTPKRELLVKNGDKFVPKSSGSVVSCEIQQKYVCKSLTIGEAIKYNEIPEIDPFSKFIPLPQKKIEISLIPKEDIDYVINIGNIKSRIADF